MCDKIKRVICLVLDGVGAGALPDASTYGDAGTNTLAHTADAVGGLFLPNLERKGLGCITSIRGVKALRDTQGAYGRLREASPGKDSTSGHWELAGVILEKAFPVFPGGFPLEFIRELEKKIGRGVLGNVAASGTEIIDELGEEHMRTGCPILYTSADSVLQLAAHKKVVPLRELYAMCRTARELLRGEYAVNRVIARPFVGGPGAFKRVGAERLDLSLPPPRQTAIELCGASGLQVKGIGKVGDLYAGRGFTSSVRTAGNAATMERILAEVGDGGEGLLMANLVDFDMEYGHRRDVWGFAKALDGFDRFLPGLESRMRREDLCMVVSDHGCDPTHSGSDHTREYAILLVFGAGVRGGLDLGTRRSFADCGKSVCDLLRVDGSSLDGTSFAAEMLA